MSGMNDAKVIHRQSIVIGMAVFWSGVIAETIRQKMQRLFCKLNDKYNRACRR